MRPLSEVLPEETAGPLIKMAAARSGVNYIQLAKNIVGNEAGNPLALAEALDLGTHREWRDWEPETLADLLGLSEGDVRQRDLVMATQVGCTNPDVFEDWTLFHHVGVVFNHRRANFTWLDALSELELAWSCSVLRGLNTREQFGPGILRYLTGVCLEQGLLYFPWIGGDGLLVCEQPWTERWYDTGVVSVGREAQRVWKSGVLSDVGVSDVEGTDPLHVQLEQLVKCAAYLRNQKERSPESYV